MSKCHRQTDNDHRSQLALTSQSLHIYSRDVLQLHHVDPVPGPVGFSGFLQVFVHKPPQHRALLTPEDESHM